MIHDLDLDYPHDLGNLMKPPIHSYGSNPFPPNMKHPLRNHGLVWFSRECPHSIETMHLGCLILGWWDDIWLYEWLNCCGCSRCTSGWWFQTFFIFHFIYGMSSETHWLSLTPSFFRVEWRKPHKPPTRHPSFGPGGDANGLATIPIRACLADLDAFHRPTVSWSPGAGGCNRLRWPPVETGKP